MRNCPFSSFDNFVENGPKKKNQVWRFSIRESQINTRGSGWIDWVWSVVDFSAESIGSEWHNAQYFCTLSPGRLECKQYSCNWRDHRTRHCIHQHGSKFVSAESSYPPVFIHSFIHSFISKHGNTLVFVPLSPFFQYISSESSKETNDYTKRPFCLLHHALNVNLAKGHQRVSHTHTHTP